MTLPCFVPAPALSLRPYSTRALLTPPPFPPTTTPLRRARVIAAVDADSSPESENRVEVLDGAQSSPAAAKSSVPVPGKMQLDEMEEARQRTALEQFSAELRKKRLLEEREAARLFGWVPYAETLNGRLAMWFILTGLLTEYWTGYTIPAQVELMARTLGVI